MKQHIYEFGPGLPGVKRGKLKGPMANSVSAFMAALREYRICSDAGDHGAVMVHRTDNGEWYCCFQRWHQTVASQTCTTKRQVEAFLREWMPAQRRRPDAA